LAMLYGVNVKSGKQKLKSQPDPVT
jgi:hypothetical protein